MKTATIEELGYFINKARQENQPKPIVFLGAGASKTGNIPLAKEIVEDILRDYSDNPRIKHLNNNEKTYPKLMECLSPFDRNKLLKNYVDTAKINVAHIYLAQFIKQGYVDYVLTVNFDNLMLRALALFNEFPPTYDMAILKDLTTTSFKEKSVVYLHGQHHGLWLLNTEEETTKVKEIIPPILHSIKDRRIWIFVGYSGQDPIFDHIKQLGRFDNGLYWVGYYDEIPDEKITRNLLDGKNVNAYLIQGYDADSFFMKLNNELKLGQPLIIDKPFESLKVSLENIVDIDDKDHFKGVKERLEIAKKSVESAIKRFEQGTLEEDDKTGFTMLLKYQILEMIANANYDGNKIVRLTDEVNRINDGDLKKALGELYFSWAFDLSETSGQNKTPELITQVCDLYRTATELNPQDYKAFTNWGNALMDLAKLTFDEALFRDSVEKYRIATELKPQNDRAFNNWGVALLELAKLKGDEALYRGSAEKFRITTELIPQNDTAFTNWGNALFELAKLTEDQALFRDSVEKFRIATELNPQNFKAFTNWGNTLLELAKLMGDESLFRDSVEKFRIATGLNPQNFKAFNNWGNTLLELAKLMGDEALFRDSVEKFRIATELNTLFDMAFNNWGTALSELAKLKGDEALFRDSLEKYRTATELNPLSDVAFNNWGAALLELAKLKGNEVLFRESMEKFRIATKLNPQNDTAFTNWGNALSGLAKLKGDEALFRDSLEKYRTATELNPLSDVAFNNWGTALLELAKLKGDEVLFRESMEKFRIATKLNHQDYAAWTNWGASLLELAKLASTDDEKLASMAEAESVSLKSITLGGTSYNLACVYALRNETDKALQLLEKCLAQKEISADHVEQDEDWKAFADHENFIALLTQYRHLNAS